MAPKKRKTKGRPSSPSCKLRPPPEIMKRPAASLLYDAERRAYKRGHDEGFEKGWLTGEEHGRDAGLRQAYEEGHADGKAKGKDRYWDKGFDCGAEYGKGVGKDRGFALGVKWTSEHYGKGVAPPSRGRIPTTPTETPARHVG